jgi:hypothetical protein
VTIPILVDCDQVLSDFVQACLDLAAEKYNVFATKEDCTKDPPWDAIGCPYLPANINEAIAKGEFVYRMKPLAGGIEFLRDLETQFGERNVYICTAPWNGEWASQRLDWLRDIAKVPMKRVITTSCKYLVQGILIDDSVKHLVNRDFGYCIAQPYNTEFKGPRGNYRECLEWLKEVTK